jgi:hypothetical protein
VSQGVSILKNASIFLKNAKPYLLKDQFGKKKHVKDKSWWGRGPPPLPREQFHHKKKKKNKKNPRDKKISHSSTSTPSTLQRNVKIAAACSCLPKTTSWETRANTRMATLRNFILTTAKLKRSSKQTHC